jgi:hypothetical protein
MITKEEMTSNKKTAKMVGALMLIATITYMLGSGLLDSILNASDYLLSISSNSAQVVIGVLLQFMDAAAVVGIGVLMFPILKKHNEATALGYAGTRIIECLLLVVAGISSLLLITLGQEYARAAAADASYFQVLGTLLVAQSKLAFQFAMIALGLGSLPFCYLLYKSKLIPRWLSGLGFIGYAALLTSGLLEVFGYSAMILFLPGALFELIFPIWIIAKGFNSSAFVSQPAKTSNPAEPLVPQPNPANS